MKRTLTAEDILPYDAFLKARPSMVPLIRTMKQNRRVFVGPWIGFFFENHGTLQWQIQEMLRIEKGGDEQLKDELEAYAPLLPKAFSDGSFELVATMMIEIDDVEVRQKALRDLSRIETMIHFKINDTICPATFETDIDRTAEDGKTSSVHFLRFVISVDLVSSFDDPKSCIYLCVNHPQYTHQTLLNLEEKNALAFDFR